jgi:hypothetical protein
MRGLRVGGAVVAIILVLSTASFAAEAPAEPRAEAPADAILQITQTSVALLLGYTWGDGTLTYQGKSLPIEIDAFSVLALGVVRARATAEVFNMKSLDDFNGTYTAGSIEGTLVAGAGATIMRNQNGVVIHFFTTTEGLNLKLSPEGIRLRIK